jgi:superfamily II DNA or RNA helicase
LKTLYAEQVVHAKRLAQSLLKHRAALDSSQTGCGKTLIAVETARALGKIPLVVCPKIVIPSWKSTLEEQGVENKGVINYEKLRTGRSGYGKFEKKQFVWTIPEDSLVIWDEVHRCQGQSSQNAKMLIAAKSMYNLCLSASAAEDPTEMRALGHILGLHNLKDFYRWAQKNGCSFNPWGGLQFGKTKGAALIKLRSEIYPEKGSRLTRTDMKSHFSKSQIITEPLDMGDDGKIQKLYEEMDAEIAELQVAMKGDKTGGGELTKQLRTRQAIELLKVPAILELTSDLLAEGQSVAIFVNFRGTLEALGSRLPDCAKIWGGQTATERQDAINSFQTNQSRVICSILSAGGLGVSLHDTTGDAPRTALISPGYDAKELLQALGRIDRAGAKSNSTQRILFAANSLEEAVEKSCRSKLKNLENLHSADLTTEEKTVGYCLQHNKNIKKTQPMPDKEQGAEPAHHKYSPSQLSSFEKCPGFSPRSGTNPIAERGTRIHKAIETGSDAELQSDEERFLAEACRGFVSDLLATKNWDI